MRDRWKNRADTPPGKGTVYWHILMGGYPEVRTLAQHAQNQLAEFTGLHMTPLEWLHISTLVAGSTDDIAPNQMQDMLISASRSLTDVPPIGVTLGPVLYHPEAIMLGVEPSDALDPALEAARYATKGVIGREGNTTSGPGTWVPHMTLCYSTAQQSASSLINALGHELPICEITVTKLTLVVQWGPERKWNWQPIGTASLAGTTGVAS
ncbi:2'-5' RNA ligase family protein [Actinomadura livida]